MEKMKSNVQSDVCLIFCSIALVLVRYSVLTYLKEEFKDYISEYTMDEYLSFCTSYYMNH